MSSSPDESKEKTEEDNLPIETFNHGLDDEIEKATTVSMDTELKSPQPWSDSRSPGISSRSPPSHLSPQLLSDSNTKSLSPVSDLVGKLTLSALKSLNFDEPLPDELDDNAGHTESAEESFHKPASAKISSKLRGSPGGFGLGNATRTRTPVRSDVGNEYDFGNTENDDYDDDDGVEDSGMDVGGDSETEDDDGDENNNVDEDNDLVVLDPDHPLMQRFQAAYKDHLLKQNEKITLEMREISEEDNNCKKRREALGVELYGIQQELARQQMHLEKHHNTFNEQSQLREHFENQLNEIRTLYKQVMNDMRHQRKKANELQTEVENVAAKILYMESAKTDIRSDINILKRAAEKADTEVTKAQREKQSQDLLVNKLVSAVDRLRGDIAMYEAQMDAQREETRAAMRTLTEASTELEAIDLEKKQLLQQWNNSLIGMKKRDEAHTAIQEAVNVQNQQIMAIETELDGYKRQIQKAQERNEHLTYMYNRIESDITSVKKQINISQNKHESLKIEYSTYSRTLHETEQFLSKAQNEVALKKSELVNLRKQIEREFLNKVKMEDLIMEKMQEQLTADKASQYSRKMAEKLRKRAKQLERNVADVENEISKDVLDVSNCSTRVHSLQETLSTINDVINQKNDTISKIENEIVKRNAVIEKKQGTIDVFSKKIDSLETSNGDDCYVGPLEFQIKTLQKQIDSTSNECLELQQYWLRQQGELVKVIREVGEQRSEIDSKKKQSTILLQKKLRIEGEINSQHNEMKDIDRNVRSMQNDMTKLNLLIHKNRDKQETLQQDNLLLENDFISTLKDAELESIQMQNSIQGLNEEKERLLNALVEAERQIMLWEKKTQLAREARDAVDSDVGHGEIHAMKAEIHRMEVRYAQLLRQQEKMIQDMEKSVFKRECIIVRGDAQAKMDRKRLGKPKENKSAFHKKIADLKKKIKQTLQESSQCEEEITSLRESQRGLANTLEDKQTDNIKLQQSIDINDNDLERMQELKQRNLSDIISKQQRAKYFSSVKSGKYNMFCKSDRSKITENEKQTERYQSLSTIIDRLNSEYPEMQTELRNVTLLLGNVDMQTERSERTEIDLA